MFRLSTILSVLLLAGWAVPPAQAGKLQQIREEVRQPDREPPPSRHCHDHDDDDESILGAILGAILTDLFSCDCDTAGDGDAADSRDREVTYPPQELAGFAPYPYCEGHRGSMQIFPYSDGPDGPPPPQIEQLRHLKPWSMRLSLEESNDFDDLNRVNGHFLWDTMFRLGIQGGWSYLHENLGGGQSDDMFLGDLNAVYRLFQHKRLQLRTGIGFRVGTDDEDTNWGVNFTVSSDWFPARPLIISTLMDAGTLGDAGVFHVRMTGGCIWHGWEIYGGYDYLKIGSVDLQGPVIGLRWWF